MSVFMRSLNVRRNRTFTRKIIRQHIVCLFIGTLIIKYCTDRTSLFYKKNSYEICQNVSSKVNYTNTRKLGNSEFEKMKLIYESLI